MTRVRPDRSDLRNGWCSHCRKWFYGSRKLARLAHSRMKGVDRMTPYACPVDESGQWHLGHLGGKTREDHRGFRRAILAGEMVPRRRRHSNRDK